MTDLTLRETELVALGAALGSNCVPCIEHHIPQARKAGLSDPEIQAAIQLADKVRQVPARKVLDAALNSLPAGAGALPGGTVSGDGCGCASAGTVAPETGSAERTMATMASMMSKMMSSCGSPGCSSGGRTASNG